MPGEGRPVGRHGTTTSASPTGHRHRACERSERDRVHRHTRPPGEARSVLRAAAALGSGHRRRGARPRRTLRLVSAAGGTSPVDERTSSTARATASPIAVPKPGARAAIPSRSARRSVVGGVRTTGSSENATRPIRIRFGTWSANERNRTSLRLRAGSGPRPSHSSTWTRRPRARRWRDRQMPRGSFAAGDRQAEERDGEEQQARDQVAAPTRTRRPPRAPRGSGTRLPARGGLFSSQR